MNGTLLGGLAAVVSDLGLGGLGLVAAFGRFRRGSPPGRLGLGGRHMALPCARSALLGRLRRLARGRGLGRSAFFRDRCSHVLSPYREFAAVMTSIPLFVAISKRNLTGPRTVE